MIVCIDSGNTRIKWGVRDADNWLAQGALAHAELAELAGLEVLLSQWKPSSVLLSNVAGPQALAGIQQAGQAVTRNAGGQLAWPGLLRKLDRSGAPYQL